MSSSDPETGRLEVGLERLPGSSARVSVAVPAAEVDRAVDLALRHLGQRYRLPGFRPGKAPAPVVERAVGWEAVRQHAVEDLVPSIWSRVVDQERLEPVTSPEVGEVNLERGQPLHFTATVVLRPPVELGDYSKIRAPVEQREVSEEDLERALEALRMRYAQLEDQSERPAELGDVLTAALTMRHNGEAVGGEGQLQTLDLEREDLLPGMAEQLVGATVGEPREVTLTLPEDYGRPELKGEMVTISAEVSQIQAKRLPPLDDNLASIAGHGETLDELREFVREQLEEELRQEAEAAQEQRALEELVKVSRVEVPEVMVQAEIDHQLRDLDLRLQASGISLEQLLASDGKQLEQLRGERRQSAVERVQVELILTELARREGLEVSDAELEGALGRILSRGTSKETRRRAREPLRRELLLGKARRLVAAQARGEAAPQEGGI